MSANHPIDRQPYVVYAAIFCSLAFFVFFVVDVGRLAVVWVLMSGWFYYFRDVVLRAKVSGPGVALGVGAALVIVVALHVLARWAVGAWGASGGGGASGETSGGGGAGQGQVVKRVWRLRWTVMIALGIVLIFVAGIAAVVIVHQVLWLVRDTLSGRVG